MNVVIQMLNIAFNHSHSVFLGFLSGFLDEKPSCRLRPIVMGILSWSEITPESAGVGAEIVGQEGGSGTGTAFSCRHLIREIAVFKSTLKSSLDFLCSFNIASGNGIRLIDCSSYKVRVMYYLHFSSFMMGQFPAKSSFSYIRRTASENHFRNVFTRAKSPFTSSAKYDLCN